MQTTTLTREHSTHELSRPSLVIFLLSEGTGVSGEHLCRSVARQFPDVKITVHVVGRVWESRIPGCLQMVAKHNGMIAHTLVHSSIRTKLNALAWEYDVPCVDLLSGLLIAVAERLQLEPTETSGAYRQNMAWHKRLSKTINFAIMHDDGARSEDWDQADCLIMGVSRTGKSPLSMFLATMGYKACNYPICPGVEIPDDIQKIPRGRCFGLTVDPEVLAKRRSHRVDGGLGRADNGLAAYTDLQKVFAEVEEVEQYYKHKQITRVDITGKSVEDQAQKILSILRMRYESDDQPSSPLAEHQRYQAMEQWAEHSLDSSISRSMSMSAEKHLTLYLVTTGMGLSGEKLANTVAGQFPEAHIDIQICSHVNAESLEGIVSVVAKEGNAIIAHTLVPKAMRKQMERLCAEKGVRSVDCYTDLLQTVSTIVDLKPSESLEARVRWDENFAFVKAVEFAIHHDNGINPMDWLHADALLLSTTPVGKSVISVFLASLGLKVANMTIDIDEALPPEFDTVDRRRVFALVARPSKRKQGPFGGEAPADPAVERQVAAVEEHFKGLGVVVIDCTVKPVEQSANLILEALEKEFGKPKDSNGVTISW